tara:strand:+ start:1574 stop:2182 length:609 start_codon:yes stop_codon:yes gene_type:complete
MLGLPALGVGTPIAVKMLGDNSGLQVLDKKTEEVSIDQLLKNTRSYEGKLIRLSGSYVDVTRKENPITASFLGFNLKTLEDFLPNDGKRHFSNYLSLTMGDAEEEVDPMVGRNSLVYCHFGGENTQGYKDVESILKDGAGYNGRGPFIKGIFEDGLFNGATLELEVDDSYVTRDDIKRGMVKPLKTEGKYMKTYLLSKLENL